MEEGRFSTRMLSGDFTFTENSVNGSTILSYGYDWKAGGVYLNIYDAESGENLEKHQKDDDVNKSLKMMITSSYYVSEKDGVVKIRNRSDGTEREVKLAVHQERIPWFKKLWSNLDILPQLVCNPSPFLPPIIGVLANIGGFVQHLFSSEFDTERILRPNNDQSSEKILIANLNIYRPHEFFVLDLDTGDMKEVKATEKAGLHNLHPRDCQLNSSLVAFKEIPQCKLRVVDSDTGIEVYSRPLPPPSSHQDLHRYFLLKDKIVVADLDLEKLAWSIVDFNGTTLNQGDLELNMRYSPCGRHVDNFFTIYKNFMIFYIYHFRSLHFVDMTSGKLLTSLSCDKRVTNVNGYDNGKFIVQSCVMQVVDFESPDLVMTKKPVNAVTINNDGTLSTKRATLGEFKVGFIDNTAKYHFNDSDEMWRTDTERVVALYNDWERLESHIPKKREKAVLDLRAVPNDKIEFDCHVLLYKEELVNGQWRPVDLSVNEVEELINVAKLAQANANNTN